ncbi:MAG: hypothetical protein MRZ36_07570 [Eubacterium sp.]|nr:hypothetical protein [Eubacterium sp.]
MTESYFKMVPTTCRRAHARGQYYYNGGTNMLRIVLLALVSILMILVLGNVKREYGFVLAFFVAVVLFLTGAKKVLLIGQQLKQWQDLFGIEAGYLNLLLKMLGIAYLTELAVSLCRDAGQGAIAGQVSFLGKLSILIISVPILESIIQLIGGILS